MDSNDTLPPGTYRARAICWDWDTAKSGSPCLAVMFELLEGRTGYTLDGRLYFDTDREDSKGRTALVRSIEVLRAMGLKGDLVAQMTGLDAGEVSLVTDINDKGYPTIKYINAPRQARELRTFNAPQPKELANFLARANRTISGNNTPAPAPAQQARPQPTQAQRAPTARFAPPPAAQDADDVPF